MSEIIIFVTAFFIPFVYWRLMFVVAKKFAEKPKLIGTGMQVHHLHYGFIMILIAAVLLLFFGENIWVTALLGFGLGLAGDEFIGSLRLPEHRAVGLEIYRDSFKETLALFTMISALLLVLGYAYLR